MPATVCETQVSGRYRAGRGAVQIADRRAAQSGVGGHAAPALGRQEGRDVMTAGGQGREVSSGAPVALRADGRAIGVAGVGKTWPCAGRFGALRFRRRACRPSPGRRRCRTIRVLRRC